MTMERYAIYYAPDRGSELDRFGSRWLGRSAWSGREVPFFFCEGVRKERLEQITCEPRHYGFHATLKPPFQLKRSLTREQLLEEMERFVQNQTPFTLPVLQVNRIGKFIALSPQKDNRQLQSLGDGCVKAFDYFRAPPSKEELKKRQIPLLSSSQRNILNQWGYPFLMEEYRFHLTLTGKIDDENELQLIQSKIEPIIAPYLRAPQILDSISLFYQPAASMPFKIIEQFRFPSSDHAMNMDNISLSQPIDGPY